MQRPRSVIVALGIAVSAYLGSFTLVVEGQSGATEAPAGFDNQSNGFLSPTEFAAAKETFEERDEIADGLGPVYNAQACSECHQNPITGAVSQISELRAGHLDSSGNFVDAPGGSLINDRATNANIQERVPGAENIRTFRMSLNTLGDGFVEAVNSNTIVALANAQPGAGNGPTVLLASHLESQQTILIYRVPSIDAVSTRLVAAGWSEVEPRLEIPQGPCLVLRDPGGQRLAVYQLLRPGMNQHFNGRFDT